MLIDASHSGERTTLDAIALSPKPIAVTHSNCKAITRIRATRATKPSASSPPRAG